MPTLLVTPRQVNQVRLAIQKRGLLEADFNLAENEQWFRITYYKTKFYFNISIQRVVPADNPTIGQLLAAASASLNPFETTCTPDIWLSSSGIYPSPKKQTAKNFDEILSQLDFWLTWIKKEYGPFEEQKLLAEPIVEPSSTALAHLHPTIQQAAGSLYATGHFRQALFDAFVAIEVAVREKSQLIGSGTKLMEVAFSPGNPVLNIGDSNDEQQGFMALFRGAMLAIRNPKAHSLGGTHDPQRALEWLSFASVLLRNLDEATLAQSPATSPASYAPMAGTTPLDQS